MVVRTGLEELSHRLVERIGYQQLRVDIEEGHQNEFSLVNPGMRYGKPIVRQAQIVEEQYINIDCARKPSVLTPIPTQILLDRQDQIQKRVW